MNILTIQQLSKKYGKFHAVRALDLSVNAGEVYGILGPNGSGKTTTLGMILNITRPSGGTYQWFGEPENHRHRQRIGVLLETPNFYPYLSAVNNLKVVAAIKRCSTDRIETVLRQVDLWGRHKQPFKTFSLGMRQRLAVGSALLADPEVLVLDEPTNGLDPQGIAEMRHIIQGIAKQGKTIIFASHILDEVEKICSHVAIMKQGQLLAAGPFSEILQSEQHLLVAAEDTVKLQQWASAQSFIAEVHPEGSLLRLSLKTSLLPSEINQRAFDDGIVLSHLQAKHTSLEERFLALTAEVKA
jgi:ABC-type multidrug transport system ATPase subunit